MNLVLLLLSYSFADNSLNYFKFSRKSNWRYARQSINRCTSLNWWKRRSVKFVFALNERGTERQQSPGVKKGGESQCVAEKRGSYSGEEERTRAPSVSVNASPPEWPINSNYGKEATITRLRGSILNPRALFIRELERWRALAFRSLPLSYCSSR